MFFPDFIHGNIKRGKQGVDPAFPDFNPHLACLDLGDVDNVIHNPHQIIASFLDNSDKLLAFLIGYGSIGEQGRESDYSVHRSSDLMRHIR